MAAGRDGRADDDPWGPFAPSEPPEPPGPTTQPSGSRFGRRRRKTDPVPDSDDSPLRSPKGPVASRMEAPPGGQHSSSPLRSVTVPASASVPDVDASDPWGGLPGAAHEAGNADPWSPTSGAPARGVPGEGRPPTWLLLTALAGGCVGAALAWWPSAPIRVLVAAWFICGFVVLGLVAAFTWLDIDRRARLHYPARPGLSRLRSAVMVLAVVGVVASAVQVATRVGRFGWSTLWQ
jgi:hypothetical protein